MKPPAGLLLPLVGLATALCAGALSAAILSPDTAAKIRKGLPAYQPPAPQAEEKAAETGPQTTDPNVLILPKVTVKEKRLPSDAADHLMSRREFNRRMENLYFDALAEEGALNVLLNNFTIPLISPFKATRGRVIYRQRELDRLRHVSDILRRFDPDAAGDFARELDNTHTTRPAGGLQKR